MFWFIESIGLYLYCEDELPTDIREQLREIVVSTPIIRGDTENHWVMFYSALLLASQTFPETSPAEWFNWNTSQANYDNAAEWLARTRTTNHRADFAIHRLRVQVAYGHHQYRCGHACSE